jgi:hypothetical protein
MAGLALEYAATPGGIASSAATVGQAALLSVSLAAFSRSILWAASSEKSQESTSDRLRAAAYMRKCGTATPVQEKVQWHFVGCGAERLELITRPGDALGRRCGADDDAMRSGVAARHID